MSLTDVAIRKAKPTANPFKLFDGGGLFILVQPSGGKWWRYKYRFSGKEKLLALGAYPEISLAEARERHAEARKQLNDGKDPSQLKQETKRLLILQGADTFEAVTREWHSGRLHIWSVKHATKLLKSFEADVFPEIGQRPVKSISASELLAMARKIEKRGALDTAHRVVQNCSQVFSYAVVSDRAERNPVVDIKGALQPVLRKNNAYLKADELPEFFTKLGTHDLHPQTRLAIELLALTFVRTTELRAATWSEMNLDKAEWRIPAERMKMRDPHIVPLSAQAITSFEELKKLTGHSSFVFPNLQKPSGFMSENTILFAIYRMGYHLRATGHGFRATASTILNEHGFNPDVIERQLAHSERNSVRAAYNHAQYMPERRKMMQWWGDYLDGLIPRRGL